MSFVDHACSKCGRPVQLHDSWDRCTPRPVAGSFVVPTYSNGVHSIGEVGAVTPLVAPGVKLTDYASGSSRALYGVAGGGTAHGCATCVEAYEEAIASGEYEAAPQVLVST